jgi:hypothetical protein
MDNKREILPEEHAKLQSLIRLVEWVMPLQKWDFRLSTRFIARFRPDIIFPSGNGRYPTVIYDSEYCRVMFALKKDFKGYELAVFYGRLHAPGDERLLKHDGEDCYCWHWNVYDLILKFLDGMSPKEAVLSRGKPPKGLEDFLGLGFQKTVDNVEFVVRYHNAIWNHYEKRLLNLFDLRHPELWEEYSYFVKEYYDRYRRPRSIVPSLDKIC